jgi:regulator of nucleoside diphosphate kinase
MAGTRRAADQVASCAYRATFVARAHASIQLPPRGRVRTTPNAHARLARGVLVAAPRASIPSRSIDSTARLGATVGRTHDVQERSMRNPSATTALPRLILSRPDVERLWRLLGSIHAPRDPDAVERLQVELERGHVVAPEDVPPGVVTMDARVVFENQDDGRRREVTLVFPERADAGAGRISVLSPIGSALYGLSLGQIIDWPLPRGRVARLKVVDVRAS